MSRTEVIQFLIDTFGYTRYLEIGVYDRSHNFDLIRCKYKSGVDPKELPGIYAMTSDSFFAQNNDVFDIVFIDGLHEKDQVLRDVKNALSCLSKDGTIVMHDCNPITEEMQRVPRIQPEWTGDTWKAYVELRRLKGIEQFVVDTDYGCGIIRFGSQVPFDFEDPDYESLEKNRTLLLKLISIDNFKSLMKEYAKKS